LTDLHSNELTRPPCSAVATIQSNLKINLADYIHWITRFQYDLTDWHPYKLTWPPFSAVTAIQLTFEDLFSYENTGSVGRLGSDCIVNHTVYGVGGFQCHLQKKKNQKK